MLCKNPKVKIYSYLLLFSSFHLLQWDLYIYIFMAKAMTCWSLHWLAAEKTLLLESLSNSVQEFNVRKLLETGNGNSRSGAWNSPEHRIGTYDCFY